MIDTDKIKEVTERAIKGSDLFIVEVKAKPGNIVEVTVDSDTSVSIDDCAEISRAVGEEFDRDAEDFELTVSSAGIGQPLKVLRQYKKLVGKPVDVVLRDGTAIRAILKGADQESITLAWKEKVAEEGKKRKKETDVERTCPMKEVKTTKEYLDFK